MALWLFRQRTIKTSLSPNEIVMALTPYVKTSQETEPLNTEQHYQGSLDKTGFKLCRIIKYRNSFQPIIIGNIETSTSGRTTVNITYRLHYLVLIFSCLWLLGVIGAPSFALLQVFSQPITTPFNLLPLLIPLTMLIFYCGMSYWGFFHELNKSQPFIEGLLKRG